MKCWLRDDSNQLFCNVNDTIWHGLYGIKIGHAGYWEVNRHCGGGGVTGYYISRLLYREVICILVCQYIYICKISFLMIGIIVLILLKVFNEVVALLQWGMVMFP